MTGFPNKPTAIGLLVLGGLLVFLGIFADVIGFGTSPGFGPKHWLSLFVGLASAGTGWFFFEQLKKDSIQQKPEKTEEESEPPKKAASG